jgi:ankyrin repeat protein
VPFIHLLAEHGADPAQRDRHGRTAYQHAVRRGRDDLAEALRDIGSPTAVAAEDESLNAISRGAAAPGVAPALDGDARDVLIELAMRDGEGLARVIAAVGANFSAQWGGGPRGTLLHQAAWFGRPDFVDLLLRSGAEVDARVETEYDTPLGWCAVGSRYSPQHPNDSFSSPDADFVAAASLLLAAGARNERRFAEMALPPLSDWLADR